MHEELVGNEVLDATMDKTTSDLRIWFEGDVRNLGGNSPRRHRELFNYAPSETEADEFFANS
jgi:hypothetical protein